jgi:trk system potassium uptake protein
MRVKHSALIVGLGRFGSAAAERLMALGWEVVGIDLNAHVVQDMQDRIEHVVQLDASDEAALRTLGVPDFEVCVVSRGTSVESSILLVLNLQQLGAKCIMAKAQSDYHARILRQLGVNEIVFPERDAGVRLAESLQSPYLVQWLQISEDRELAVIRVPEERVGTSLKKWREMHKPSLQILGHLTAAGRPLNLDMNAPLGREETIVVVGTVQDIITLGSRG